MFYLGKDMDAQTTIETLLPFYRYCLELAEPDYEFNRFDATKWMTEITTVRPDRFLIRLFGAFNELSCYDNLAGHISMLAGHREIDGEPRHTIAIVDNAEETKSLLENKQGWRLVF